MGKLIEVKCPGCAAALRIDGELSHATCEYCGALSEIRRETAPKTLLNMMRPPPPPPVDGPKVIRVSSVGKGCLIAILLPPALFVLLFIVLVIIFAIKEAVNDGPASQPAATGSVAVPTTDSGGPTRSTWLGHRQPLLFDASGDGSDDVIGWVRSTAEAAGGEHLTAFDPIAGRTLWTSARLGESASSQKLHAALADGRVLVADAGGVLHGLDARTGVELWRTSLEERLDRYCGQGPGRVGLVLVDRRVLVVEVATGQVRPNREAACQPLWTDEPGDTPLVDIAGRLFHNDAKRLPRLAGVDVTLGLRELATGHQAATGLPPARGSRSSSASTARDARPRPAGRDRWPTSGCPRSRRRSPGSPSSPAVASWRPTP